MNNQSTVNQPINQLSSSMHCSHSLSGWRSPGSAAVHGNIRGEGGSHWKPLQENHRGNGICQGTTLHAHITHITLITRHTHHTHHTHTLTRTLCRCQQEGCKCGGWTLMMWRGVCGTWWGWPRNCTQMNHATSELWVCITGRATTTHTHTPHTSHPPTQDYIVMSNLDGSLSTSIAISFLYNGLIDLKVLPERAFGTVWVKNQLCCSETAVWTLYLPSRISMVFVYAWVFYAYFMQLLSPL